jgi:hypothetical protein
MSKLDEALTKAQNDILCLNKAREISQSDLNIPMTAPVIYINERINKNNNDVVLQRLLLAAKKLKW